MESEQNPIAFSIYSSLKSPNQGSAWQNLKRGKMLKSDNYMIAATLSAKKFSRLLKERMKS